MLAVLFDWRVLAVFALAAFGGSARRARVACVARGTRPAGIGLAGRALTRGDVAAFVSVSADRSVSRAASTAGASRGFLVFTGCQVCGDPKALCLRSSRAASS